MEGKRRVPRRRGKGEWPDGGEKESARRRGKGECPDGGEKECVWEGKKCEQTGMRERL